MPCRMRCATQGPGRGKHRNARKKTAIKIGIRGKPMPHPQTTIRESQYKRKRDSSSFPNLPTIQEILEGFASLAKHELELKAHPAFLCEGWPP